MHDAERLDTWKQIAGFLGRDERTAKRWEATRGLPVRRMPGGRSTVFAYRAELAAWVAQAPPDPADDGAPQPPPSGVVAVVPGFVQRRRLLLAGGAVALIAGVAALTFGTPAHRPGAIATPPDRYLHGVYAWNTRTRAGLTEAVADFSQVILATPNFAPAYAGLANSYNLMPEFTGMPASQAFPQARLAAERAVALDDRLPDAHRALAFVLFWWNHDTAGSEREFRRALALDAASALTHHWFANTLAMRGDSARALAEIETAEQLDPASTAIRADKAHILTLAGRTAEAADQLRSIVAAAPGFAQAHRYLAILYQAAGDTTAADEMLAAARLGGDKAMLDIARAAQDGAKSGGAAGMREAIYRQEDRLYRAGAYSPYALARSAAALDPERAIGLLEASLAANEVAIMGVRADPAFAPLHDNARYRALVARVHLDG